MKKNHLHKGLKGSLAFRVLSIGCLFVVIPLVVYSIYIYKKDYSRRIKSVFQELKVIEQEQVEDIIEKEIFQIHFLDVIHDFVLKARENGSTISDLEIVDILKVYVGKEGVSAIIYLTVEDDRLMATSSTEDLYKDVNFSPYISASMLKGPKGVFVAENPKEKEAFYIYKEIRDQPDHIHGYAIAMISFERMLSQVNHFDTIYPASIALLNGEGMVKSAQYKKLEGKKIEIGPIKENGGETLYLKAVEGIKDGYKYTIGDEVQFGILTKVEGVDAYFLLSLSSKIVMQHMREQMERIIVLLIFILFLGGVITYLFSQQMSKPLLSLSSVMTRVGQGDLKAHYEKKRFGFEINRLGSYFNQMIDDLKSHIEETQRERAMKESLAKELEIGNNIQQSMLPQKDKSYQGMEIVSYFSPAKEVAGDFYDIYEREEDLLLTIADGVGKGVYGMLYAYDLRSILRALSYECKTLKEIITKSNDIFCNDTQDSGNFVTAFISRFVPEERILTFANLGHNEPVLIRKDGTIERLSAHGIAFGVQAFGTLEIGKIDVSSGDKVIYYTDGINEAQNRQGELFSEKRLLEVINEHKDLSINDLKDRIIESVEEFVGERDQHDDMTLIVMEIKS